MGTLLAKIKLVWQGRGIAENLMQIKSKWKEPTFWVSLLGNATTLLATYKGILDPKVAICLNAAFTAAYNYVRGLQKAQTDGVKPYSSSSEFWLGIATMVNNAAIDIQTGGVATTYLAGSRVLIGHAIAAARDLANMRPKEVSAATGEATKPAV
jgi:hypothetical protein